MIPKLSLCNVYLDDIPEVVFTTVSTVTTITVNLPTQNYEFDEILISLSPGFPVSFKDC